MFLLKVCLLLSSILIASGDVSSIVPKPQLDGRIVGGFQIDITEVPWQVSLQTRGSHFCGGTIIGTKWILTAAHCTTAVASNPKSITIKSGASEYKDGATTKVVRVVNHPKFNGRTIDYDFALLELAEDMQFDDNRNAIKLDDKQNRIVDGSTCLVTGWGNTQNIVEPSYILRGAEVPIVPQSQCARAYKRYGGITPRMLCAGLYNNGGKDACQGDSGGPLVQYSDAEATEPRLVGVVSWGYGCAKPSFPGVYSRVQEARQWISQVTGI